MEIADVVRKLIGDIEPVGETYADKKSLENLKGMTALVDELLRDIFDVSEFKACAEHSRHLAGKHAHEFLKYICEEFKS